MNKVANIRAAEKKYHDFCYDNYSLFEPGSWLHKPVKTVINLLEGYKNKEYVSVLDLGSGIGRNSIPIAESMKNRNGKVICVDLLESALEKLLDYSKNFGVEQFIVPKLSDIEHFIIDQEEYDIIVAVSALEHVSSESVLERKLTEMSLGTKPDGANCIIIGSNIKEINLESGLELDPMFEVNITTERMLELLDYCYASWEVEKRFVKPLEYEIERNGQLVKLTTDCITYIAKKRYPNA